MYVALSSGVSTVLSPPRNLTSWQDVPSSLLAESDEGDCAQAHVSSARNKGKSLVISSSYSKTYVHRATALRLLTSERTSQSFCSFSYCPNRRSFSRASAVNTESPADLLSATR